MAMAKLDSREHRDHAVLFHTDTDFLAKMDRDGWMLFKSVVDPKLVQRMAADLDQAKLRCEAIQQRQGVASDAAGTVHHLIGQADSFLAYLADLPLLRQHTHFFGGVFILNAFGGFVNERHTQPYASRIHRDLRSHAGGQRLMLNTLVMLDDFTEANGATYLATGSHRWPDQPSEEAFYACAERAVAPAGSVLMFDSNLWHAAGPNRTEAPRRGVTPMFARPFFKPQFDYPRALGYDRGPSLDPFLRQVLGYNARIPATLEEWYQPSERRLYQSNQG